MPNVLELAHEVKRILLETSMEVAPMWKNIGDVLVRAAEACESVFEPQRNEFANERDFVAAHAAWRTLYEAYDGRGEHLTAMAPAVFDAVQHNAAALGAVRACAILALLPRAFLCTRSVTLLHVATELAASSARSASDLDVLFSFVRRTLDVAAASALLGNSPAFVRALCAHATATKSGTALWLLTRAAYNDAARALIVQSRVPELAVRCLSGERDLLRALAARRSVAQKKHIAWLPCASSYSVSELEQYAVRQALRLLGNVCFGRGSVASESAPPVRHAGADVYTPAGGEGARLVSCLLLDEEDEAEVEEAAHSVSSSGGNLPLSGSVGAELFDLALSHALGSMSVRATGEALTSFLRILSHFVYNSRELALERFKDEHWQHLAQLLADTASKHEWLRFACGIFQTTLCTADGSTSRNAACAALVRHWSQISSALCAALAEQAQEGDADAARALWLRIATFTAIVGRARLRNVSSAALAAALFAHPCPDIVAELGSSDVQERVSVDYTATQQCVAVALDLFDSAFPVSSESVEAEPEADEIDAGGAAELAQSEAHRALASEAEASVQQVQQFLGTALSDEALIAKASKGPQVKAAERTHGKVRLSRHARKERARRSAKQGSERGASTEANAATSESDATQSSAATSDASRIGCEALHSNNERRLWWLRRLLRQGIQLEVSEVLAQCAQQQQQQRARPRVARVRRARARLAGLRQHVYACAQRWSASSALRLAPAACAVTLVLRDVLDAATTSLELPAAAKTKAAAKKVAAAEKMVSSAAALGADIVRAVNHAVAARYALLEPAASWLHALSEIGFSYGALRDTPAFVRCERGHELAEATRAEYVREGSLQRVLGVLLRNEFLRAARDEGVPALRHGVREAVLRDVQQRGSAHAADARYWLQSYLCNASYVAECALRGLPPVCMVQKWHRAVDAAISDGIRKRASGDVDGVEMNVSIFDDIVGDEDVREQIIADLAAEDAAMDDADEFVYIFHGGTEIALRDRIYNAFDFVHASPANDTAATHDFGCRGALYCDLNLERTMMHASARAQSIFADASVHRAAVLVFRVPRRALSATDVNEGHVEGLESALALWSGADDEEKEREWHRVVCMSRNWRNAEIRMCNVEEMWREELKKLDGVDWISGVQALEQETLLDAKLRSVQYAFKTHRAASFLMRYLCAAFVFCPSLA